MATEAGLSISEAETGERCLRCGAVMEWRHQTWQCGTCGLKLGCCEGEPQSCEEGGGGSAGPH